MSTSIRFIRYAVLALVVAGVMVPCAQAASVSESRDAAFRAAHWNHEDATSRAASMGSLAPSVQAHWAREDAQYARTALPRQPQLVAPAGEAGEGVRRAVLTAGGGVVALLVLGTAAVTGVRRRRRVAPS